jgi:hypothetical protein
MDSFHRQRKREKGFINETNDDINEINYYYSCEKKDFNEQFIKKQKKLMDDYSGSINFFDFNRGSII